MASVFDGEEQVRKLYVGSLNKVLVDDADLKQYFEKYGSVIDASIKRSPSGESRGFGFVLFENAASADKVIAEQKNGFLFDIKGQSAIVKRAMPSDALKEKTSKTIWKIFVGGLSKRTTEEDLWKHFGEYGGVKAVQVKRDFQTKLSRGFAFVELMDEDGFTKCVIRKNHQIGGKICEVRPALHGPVANFSTPASNFSTTASTHLQQNRTFSEHLMPLEEVIPLIREAYSLGQKFGYQTNSVTPSGVAAMLLGISALPVYSPPLQNPLFPSFAQVPTLQQQPLQHQQPNQQDQLQQQMHCEPCVTNDFPIAGRAELNSDALKIAQLLQERGISATTILSVLSKGLKT